MENTYEKISDSDFDLFGNLIHQARGRVALNKFAIQCGRNARIFASYTRKGERSVCSTEKTLRKLVDPIVENADPDSGVTEEKMFAAMGFLPKEYIKAAYKYYLKKIYGGDHSPGYNYQILYDSIIEEMSEKEKEDVAFVEFLDDISFFEATLPNGNVNAIRQRLYKIYGEKTLVKLLHKFHVETLKVYGDYEKDIFTYLQYEDIQKIPVADNSKVKEIHIVLTDLLSDY